MSQPEVIPWPIHSPTRRWRPWPLVLTLTVAGALACGPGLPALGGPAATATLPPAPTLALTETAAALPPTEAPAPTEQPTSEPTATPDATALVQAQAAQTQAAAVEIIEPDLERYGLTTRQGALGWVHDPVTLSLTKYQEHQIVVDYPDMSVADFVVQADVTWNTSSGLAGCGFAVRAAPGLQTQVQYELLTVRLSGAPLWFFGLFAGRSTGNLIASGDAPTLSIELDSTNTLAVVGQGSQFSFFANGFRVGEAADDNLHEGVVAFLARQESGRTTCTFENAWLWVLRPGSGVQAR